MRDEKSVIDNIQMKMQFQDAKEKLKIDAVYFYQPTPNTIPIPVIYFKKFQSIDQSQIALLHRRVWNQGKTPILFVISPSEIKVYNCFVPPPENKDENIDGNQRLIQILTDVIDEEQIRQTLREFNRIDITEFYLSGTQDKFKINNRADKHLLKNLNILRKKLKETGLNVSIINILIERCIFILSLEDRNFLRNFLEDFEGGNFGNFREILKNKEQTYNFFEFVGNSFKGDLFPVSAEEQIGVTNSHLKMVRSFLNGMDLENGQTRLWPYSFDIIPIEFISHIYEEFLEKEDQKLNYSHHTPQFLVDFLLNQTVEFEKNPNIKILDPACGSGIFLVVFFRQLIRTRMILENRFLSLEEAKYILNHQIFGVDIQNEAIRVAAFSLYLILLDSIDPDSLFQRQDIFPSLIKTNLFPYDFLDIDDIFYGFKFDIIIGNAPWASDKKTVSKFLAKNEWKYNVGDFQLAQAFLWQCTKFVNPNSIICLIVTAKGFLFNLNSYNKNFRKQFFEENRIQTIINLSELKGYLFEKAKSPAAVVVYSISLDNHNPTGITYIVPKASNEAQNLGALILDDSDIKQIPQDASLEDDAIWKCAMVGNPRDWDLIKKLRENETLSQFLDNFGTKPREGFKLGNRSKSRSNMIKFKYLSFDKIGKFFIPNDLNNCKWRLFERPRKRRIYRAPLCLCKRNPKNGEIYAAFSDKDICYNDSIMGIVGKPEDVWMLKILTAYFNCKIVPYYFFQTSPRWSIDRPDIYVRDYLQLPIVIPKKDSEMANEIIRLHDILTNLSLSRYTQPEEWNTYLSKLEKCFYKLLKLNDIDEDLINETILYSPYFMGGTKESIAYKSATDEILNDYASRFQKSLNMMLSKQETVSAKIYTGSKKLLVIQFSIDKSNNEKPEITRVDVKIELRNLLERLSSVLHEEISENIYVNKILQIFEGDAIYFIKPNETRFWTRSAAYKDADDIIAESLKLWREGESVKE